ELNLIFVRIGRDPALTRAKARLPSINLRGTRGNSGERAEGTRIWGSHTESPDTYVRWPRNDIRARVRWSGSGTPPWRASPRLLGENPGAWAGCEILGASQKGGQRSFATTHRGDRVASIVRSATVIKFDPFET